jgi:membrane protein implicated in regulation of membrane protease activity
MSESTLWWIVAGFFVSAELLTGTFYLLMLALGAAGAAVCATLGFGHTVQFASSAVLGGGAVYLWHRKLLKRGVLDTEGYATTGLGSLDVGERVQVQDWGTDGTARVHYRGSEWLARSYGTHVPESGAHRIKKIESNYLVLERA